MIKLARVQVNRFVGFGASGIENDPPSLQDLAHRPCSTVRANVERCDLPICPEVYLPCELIFTKCVTLDRSPLYS